MSLWHAPYAGESADGEQSTGASSDGVRAGAHTDTSASGGTNAPESMSVLGSAPTGASTPDSASILGGAPTKAMAAEAAHTGLTPGLTSGFTSETTHTTFRRVDATVELPGSKSLTNRYLVLAALSDSPVTITAPLVARDTVLMAQALEHLGMRIDRSDDHAWRVFPATALHGGHIDCGLAGTVMRFVPPLAALASGVSTIDGDEGARKRPIDAMVAALEQLGVQVQASQLSDAKLLSDGGPLSDGEQLSDDSAAHLPLRITGTGSLAGGIVSINASASSQFVSGLLLAAPRFAHGLDLRHCGGELPSLPHIRMTLALLRQAGVRVHEYDAAGSEILAPALSAQLRESTTRLPESSRSTDASAQPADPTAVTPAAQTPPAQMPPSTQAQPTQTPTPAAPGAPVRWVVEPGPVHLEDVTVEPDLSNAGPFLAAAMVTGGRIRIPNWPLSTTQPGAELPRIFEAMGGRTRIITTEQADFCTASAASTAADSASTRPAPARPVPAHSAPAHSDVSARSAVPTRSDTPAPSDAAARPDTHTRSEAPTAVHHDAPPAVTPDPTHGTLELVGPPPGAIQAIDMNLHAVGELVPTIAAVAAFTQGESHLRDIGQLRGHETNRLAALRIELAKIGVSAYESGDDLTIIPAAAHGALAMPSAISPAIVASTAPAGTSAGASAQGSAGASAQTSAGTSAGVSAQGSAGASAQGSTKTSTGTCDVSHEERDANIYLDSYADHRMATFGAILGLRVPHVFVDDIETTSKTLPQFPQLWAAMLEQSAASQGRASHGQESQRRASQRRASAPNASAPSTSTPITATSTASAPKPTQSAASTPPTAGRSTPAPATSVLPTSAPNSPALTAASTASVSPTRDSRTPAPSRAMPSAPAFAATAAPNPTTVEKNA